MLDRRDSGRFRIHGKLGSGGMGVVYEAFDRQRDTLVALKTLRSIDGPTLYRFKREFRALADIAHRNLVTLYELISIDGEWLFTMERIRGQSFLRHVRPDDDDPASGKHNGSTQTAREIPVGGGDDFATVETAAMTATPLAHASLCDLPRLRAGMRELSEGVAFLHRSNRLHRDLKPSNVLVEDLTDRVVLCDFGLVAELTGSDAYQTGSDKVMGTVAYMSPEQARGAALTEASDWYSVGVMLYQALTGEVPFGRNMRQLLDLKCSVEPPPPHTLVDGVPADLDQLCTDLLRIDAGARPAGPEVLRRLGASERAPLHEPPALAHQPFVGRADQLAALRAAHACAIDGQAVTAYVRGPSGMGKSALVNRFLDEIADDPKTLVLSGRCFQNEALRYKAFDSLIDDLSNYLTRLDGEQLEALLPEDAPELARLFPVLLRVPAINEPSRRRFGARDPLELRQAAFGALRELFHRLSQRGPLVLYIDDLQWADVDSAVLFREVLRGTDAPAALLIATYRTEEEDSSPLLRALLSDDADTATTTVAIEVTPLSPDEAAALARGIDPHRTTAAIGDESGGNPLLIGELVRYLAGRTHVPGDTPRASIDAMLRARIEALPQSARTLLAIAALIGRPATLELLRDASEESRDPVADALVLEQQSLLKRRGEREVEIFHDRVRETAVAMLADAELRSHHHRIATALQRTGVANPTALVEHWLAAGEHERAVAAAIPAAAAANAALAFDRAAYLYELALSHATSADDAQELRVSLADALANAGRGSEAARAFIAASEHSRTAARRVTLEQRAALALLRSGNVDEGVQTLSGVLETVGFRRAPTLRRAVATLLAQRALLRVRGMGFTRRDESQVSPEQLARIEVCWTAAVGLGMVDPVRGAEFQVRHLLLALRCGEPNRIARAMGLEVAFLCLTKRGRRRARTVMAHMQKLVDSLDSVYDTALLAGVRAFCHYQAGELDDARALMDRMIPVLRQRGKGAVWEIFTGELYRLWIQYYQGDIAGATARVRALRREAAARGDVYAGSTLRTGFPAVAMLLETDAHDQLEAQVARAAAMWSKQGYHTQHFWMTAALGHRDLYLGDGESALRRMAEESAALEASFILRVDMMRVDALHMRGRAATAAARGAEREARLRAAARDARSLRRHVVHSMRALGVLLDGCIAVSRGADARETLAAADAACQASGLALFAACARYRLGEHIGGHEGHGQRDQAADQMRAQGVADPVRAADMLAPIARD